MKRLIWLFVVFFTLTGCEKMSQLVSGENAFIESFTARWTNGQEHGAFSVAKIEDKLIGIDETGTVMVITPIGKLDKENQRLPIQVSIYNNFNEYGYLSELIQSLAECKSNCTGLRLMMVDPMKDEIKNSMGQSVGIDGKSPSEAAYFAGLNLYRDDRSKFRADLLAHKDESKSAINFKAILYNASKVKDQIKLAIENDSGVNVINMGYVRKLNNEEINQLNNYQKFIADRIKIADNAFDSLIKLIDQNIQIEAAAKANPLPKVETDQPADKAQNTPPN